MMLHVLRAVQNQDNRIGSSRDFYWQFSDSSVRKGSVTNIEVSKIEDDIWYESAHEEAEATTTNVVSGLARQCSLRGANDRPGDDDEGDPSVRTELLADESAR